MLKLPDWNENCGSCFDVFIKGGNTLDFVVVTDLVS